MKRALLAIALLLGCAAEAQEHLAPEGYTGLLTTPTAWVQQQGEVQALLTNHSDPRFREGTSTATFALATGFLPYLELGFRLTDVNPSAGGRFGIRDLSLGAKLQLPLDLIAPGLPFALAVGANDEGGAAPFFRTRYLVGSAEAWRLRTTVGYGTGPDRLQGVFAGAELRLFDFAHLLADYDTKEAHAGLRLSASFEVADVPLRVALLAKTRFPPRLSETEWAATLTVPVSLSEPQAIDADVRSCASVMSPLSAEPLTQLQGELVDIGFQNVRVGHREDVLVVEYENNVFSHSESEALAVVLGQVAHRAQRTFKTVRVVMLRTGLPVAEVTASVEALKSHYGLTRGGERLSSSLDVKVVPAQSQAEFISEPVNRTALHAQLFLQPGLKHFVGTESGVYQAQFSVRPELVVPLWTGAAFYGRADIPVARTSALQPGGELSRFRTDPRLDHALLSQTLRAGPGLVASASAGILFADSAGVTAEVAWLPGSGAHSLGVQTGYRVTRRGERLPAAVAAWRYNHAPSGALAVVRAGQFLEGDRGVRAEFGRYFGDVLIGVYGAATSSRVLGVQLSLPLTLPREMKPGWLQVRGARRTAITLQSVVGEPSNDLREGTAQTPLSPYSVESVLLDAGRVNADSLGYGITRGRRAFERQWACRLDQR